MTPTAAAASTASASTHASPRTYRKAPLDAANPVAKLGVLVVLSIPLLVTIDIVSASVALGLIVACAPLAGFGPIRLYRRVKPLLLLAPIAGISMLLYAKSGGQQYWSFGVITVSENSVTLAVAVTLRALALALPAVILFARVDPTDTADGLIQVAHLPDRFVLGTLAGARLVSLFRDDWHSLELSRRARGLGDASRLRQLPAMAFVLLVFAMRRGSALATAMEARGFGGSIPRSHARTSRLSLVDAALIVGGVAIVGTAVAVAVAAGTFRVVGS